MRAAWIALPLLLAGCAAMPGDVAPTDAATPEAAVKAPAPRPGLFAAFRPKAKAPASLAEELATSVADTPDPATETAGDTAAAEEPAAETARPPRPTGLAALFAPRAATGMGAASGGSTVAEGQVLPFGEVGVACGVSKSALGREVDSFPKTGRTVWRLYDTDPSRTDPHTQYITGFSDGCARQVTAALGLFGAPDVHEARRYAPGNKSAYSKTDSAYEALKARKCGVSRGTPCPPAKLAAMEKRTSFVTLYPRFGASSGWLVLLLSDGKLIEASTDG